MKHSEKILRALNFAAAKHNGQKRKADGLPFIVHPVTVAWILSDYTNNENAIIAALLHDIMEDVRGHHYDEIVAEFGRKVAELVKDVSENKDPNELKENELPWLVRKQAYLNHLKKNSKEAKLISTADKMHNLQSMMDAYDTMGEKMWSKFNSPGEKKIWFYEEVLKIVSGKIPKKMENEYAKIIDKAKKKFKLC